jgi:hypothetical protein
VDYYCSRYVNKDPSVGSYTSVSRASGLFKDYIDYDKGKNKFITYHKGKVEPRYPRAGGEVLNAYLGKRIYWA